MGEPTESDLTPDEIRARRVTAIVDGLREQRAAARPVLWVDETRVMPGGHIIPAVSFEDEPGFYEVTVRWDVDLATARRWCRELNTRAGLTEDDALAILISSHRASQARREHDRDATYQFPPES